MMKWGNPDIELIEQRISRESLKDELCESQIRLNRELESSFGLGAERNNKTIIHNHFNITINMTPYTNEERLTSIVEKLTSIVERVN